MSSTIILDFTKIAQAGNDIKSSAKSMSDCLNEVSTVMRNSKSSYDSDSGEKLRSNFVKAQSKFSEFKAEMDKYGQFLVNEAQAREKDDTTVGNDTDIVSF